MHTEVIIEGPYIAAYYISKCRLGEKPCSSNSDLYENHTYARRKTIYKYHYVLPK